MITGEKKIADKLSSAVNFPKASGEKDADMSYFIVHKDDITKHFQLQENC